MRARLQGRLGREVPVTDESQEGLGRRAPVRARLQGRLGREVPVELLTGFHSNARLQGRLGREVPVELLTGFHSNVRVGRFPSGRDYLLKRYGHRTGGLDRAQAFEITSRMKDYGEIARSLGIPVVRPYGFMYVRRKESDGNVDLVEVVPRVGPDLRIIFAIPEVTDTEALALVETYLNFFRKVWHNNFPISLDPPPANFCVSPEGEMWYVDCMPPRQKLPNGRVLNEWPEPPPESNDFITGRYFSPLQARVIYPQLLRSLALGGRAIPPTTIKELIGKSLGAEAYAAINLDRDTESAVLDSPRPEDADALRFIAGEARYNNKITDDDLKKIYHLTHIGVGGILPQKEDFIKAVGLLGGRRKSLVTVPHLGENELYLPGEKLVSPRSWVIFDLDGVLIRWVKAHLPNTQEQTEFFLLLDRLKRANVEISVLTNRPPGQLATLAYQLGVRSGLWVTEGGASFYDVAEHRAYVAPSWIEFARERVLNLRIYLGKTLEIPDVPLSKAHAQFEPGMGMVKTVIIPPGEMSPSDYAENWVRPALSLGSFDQDFVAKVGKAVDVDPKDLSKEAGMALLLELNQIHPQKTPTVFIADHERDVAAARHLADLGGQVAAVGNADELFASFVEQAGGILAPKTTSYHSSATHILNVFQQQHNLAL